MKKLITATLFGLLSTAIPSHATTLEAASLLELPTFETISEARALLTRKEDVLELNIETRELPAGAYTVWFDAINRPENCDGICDFEDVISKAEEIQLSEFFFDGGVVGEDGIGNFSGQVFEGVLPTGADQITRDFTGGQGLIDALTAEVYFFIRWHGPVNPDLLEEQTTTFNGGCSVTPGDGLFEGCTELQASGQFVSTSVP